VRKSLRPFLVLPYSGTVWLEYDIADTQTGLVGISVLTNRFASCAFFVLLQVYDPCGMAGGSTIARFNAGEYNTTIVRCR
jgi:hypothetical protein